MLPDWAAASCWASTGNPITSEDASPHPLPLLLELEGTVAKRPADAENRQSGSSSGATDEMRSSFVILTEAPVAGQLLVDLLHSFDVETAGLCMVHHRLWVMHSNNTLGCLLHNLGSIPGIINILGWKPPQNGQVAPKRKEEKEEM